MKHYKSPLTRYEKNPIITPDDMPFECYAVYNAGSIMHDGKVLLMLRVDDCTRRSRYHVATSADGINFDINPEPVTIPDYEVEKLVGKHSWAPFDMRITWFEEDQCYYVFHALPVGNGCVIGLYKTTDFEKITPLYTSEPFNRNAVLFPEKINGLYCRLDRPQGPNGGGDMWVSYSPDLIFWGKSAPIKTPKTPWTGAKVGASCIPIKTEHGWLEIYHGVGTQSSGVNYFLGACLLELNAPEKALKMPDEYILAPQKIYEMAGQVPNVVFSGGCVEMPDGTLNVYYAGADTVICVAQSTVTQLVDFCLERG